MSDDVNEVEELLRHVHARAQEALVARVGAILAEAHQQQVIALTGPDLERLRAAWRRERRAHLDLVEYQATPRSERT